MDDIFAKLYQQHDLSQTQSKHLFNAIIQGNLDSHLLAVALTCLKLKGESPAEIAGAAQALIDNAAPFPRPDTDFADIVGTGGDGANTINISTASAFVAAACGVKIAKHGNRSVSSLSGSSDVLSELGIALNISAETSRLALDELGVCFLFAPHYHRGVRHAMAVRQLMKTRTLFNLIGPLINPAKPKREVMGVYDPALLPAIAQTMINLGFEHSVVVHGSGLDEVAIHGPTQIAEVTQGKIEYFTLTPADFGVKSYPLSAIVGGDPKHNAAQVRAILQGKGTDAQQAAIAINVALLLRLFGHHDLKANTERAFAAMASGKPYQLATELAARTQLQSS